MIRSLLSNIRFYVLLFSIVLSVSLYLFVSLTIPSGPTQIIKLTEYYALTAVTLLYLALLAGPFCYTFSFLPYRKYYLKSRRALGVSAFYFAFLHFLLSFFGLLGGFEGIPYLSGTYLFSITLAFIALTILFSMAATSFDSVIEKMTFRRWKNLHRLVYLAGVFALIHALLLGSHFQDLYSLIPQIFFIALVFLLSLELLRIDAFMKKRYPQAPLTSILTLPLFALLAGMVLYSLLPVPSTGSVSWGIHAEHLKLARERQKEQNQTPTTSYPGGKGDRTKRFSVSLTPLQANPLTDTLLAFTVFDAATGTRTELFQKLYEKQMHLIVVDSTLEYFTHLHPELDDSTFEISTQFPKEDVYRLYTDFQPFGATEQQFAFSLPVGDGRQQKSTQQPDKNLTKVFGDYEVTLSAPPLDAQEMSIGNQTLTFTIKDAGTEKPVTTLEPYLGAFGHLVMIKQDNYAYLHVHPQNPITPTPGLTGGPGVSFVPLGLYGAIQPGIYRVFAQFNPDGNLFTADFTVKVE